MAPGRRLVVLFDTSVVVAGARVTADPTTMRYAATLLTHWKRGEVLAVMSDPLLEEYDRVLAQEPNVDDHTRADILGLAKDGTRTRHVSLPASPFPRVSPDPDDDHLFALVTAADPDFLCTQDIAGVLDLHIYRDTVIVDPSVLHQLLAIRRLAGL